MSHKIKRAHAGGSKFKVACECGWESPPVCLESNACAISTMSRHAREHIKEVRAEGTIVFRQRVKEKFRY